MSLFVGGTSHIALVIFAVRRANQLAEGRRAMSPEKIYTSVIAISCIPFAVLFMIPPIVVGLTGLAILPLLIRMERWIESERVPELPTAMARFHPGGI
jgi:hypothetical protein